TKKGAAVRKAILEATMPKDLEEEIAVAYRKLSKEYKVANVDTAVRSSATAEDLPDASFAGQQETFLNIKGEKEVILSVKKCIASLFTNRAISYRVDKGFDHFKIALSAGVQKMVRSDLGSSGVMFSIDTESGFENVVLINSIYGLGENIVLGRVNPDEFYVFKPTKAIISRSIGKKNLRMIYNTGAGKSIKNVEVKPIDQARPSIDDKQVVKLAEWAIQIEKHYGRPMDMEWALDGKDGQLYIVQARPETVQSQKNINVVEKYHLEKKGELIISGQSVGSKIGAGVVRKIMDIKEIGKFKKGEILVTDMTDPDWEPIMKIASAIVTDKGGRTCHAAIISREMGIPCVVGTGTGSKIIKTGQKITVNCAGGEEGYVYKNILPFRVEKTDIKNIKRPKTKIMMNVGEPDQAFADSFIPNDGVGLARMEFIINNYIKAHPLALINYSKIKDAKTKKTIDEITVGYKDKKQFFIDKMAEGVGTIAAAFYPKDVIIRLSDFKTNEYANLLGGREYEPIESNPMIGYRGASRYYSEKFLPAFEMECEALRKVRDDMGLTNLKIMIPFCRTVEEGLEVMKIMERKGLKRGKNNLQIYVMAEIPANIILAEKFARHFDGFSIGSNDLTQLTLGIDRDAGGALVVAGASNEKNEAVKTLIQYLIEVGKATKTKVGICGQAPSDFVDFAEFLVECGIDSISLIPDTVIKTTIAVYKKEEEMKKGKKRK
ncbi:MAG: phosphoenolpyruvate synthase, partial [Candidatus Magasanikbacteria bacterium]|nr:phosphoenolpyruvate synthase [Candidatus Magasanikbacteria bacterium]